MSRRRDAVNKVPTVLTAMSARPPPARPHIGIHPSSPFEYMDWAEDDAWDSASDEESSSKRAPSWNRSVSGSSARSASSTTAPKPVPKPPNGGSSLAASFTHVHAPSPGSYPPKPELAPTPAPANGWTIVRTSREIRRSVEANPTVADHAANGDVDVEGSVIVGEEAEVIELPPSTKLKPSRSAVRENVDDIVNGKCQVLIHTLID
jgi:hypothetical protein